jgi:hypothetical protein
VCAVELQRWRTKRPACAHSRVAAAAEETGRVESVRRRLREFWDKNQNDTGRATIYMFETIRSGS